MKNKKKPSYKYYIENATSIEEKEHNAKFQLKEIEYYLSNKDYESARLKATYLLSYLSDLVYMTTISPNPLAGRT